MAYNVIMPKQGLQMTEGTITKWLVQEGDFITAGQPLFEMETDKLSISIDASYSGTLLKIVKDEGETVPITETIAIIGDDGEAAPVPEPASAPMAVTEKKEEIITEKLPETISVKAQVQGEKQKVGITPRAKTFAAEREIDIKKIKGSGPDGLIIARDIPKEKEKASSASAYQRIKVDMHEIKALKEQLKNLDNDMDVSVLIGRAVNKAQQRYPITESDISIVDFGSYELDECMINPEQKEDAVLTVGKITDTPVCTNNKVEIRPIVKLTLSFNQNKIETTNAAEFLRYLKKVLEKLLFLL